MSLFTLYSMAFNRRAQADHFQRTSAGGFPLIFLLTPFLVGLPGCHPDHPEPQYGAPYEIIVNEIASGPDTPPRITGDWLLVTLSYSGGCTDHTFELETFARPDTAFIWLNHFDSDDTCETLIFDDLNVSLPSAIRDADVVAMFDPAGGPPYILKWHR